MMHSASHKLFAQAKPLILLSAHGDALTSGRMIKNQYERDQAHAFTYELGKKLQAKTACSLALTHEKTDTPQPWQLVSLINKFNATLLLKIYVYHEPSAQPHCSLYYLTYNPLTQASYRPFLPCELIPFKRAHTLCFHRTKHYAHMLKSSLEKSIYAKNLSLHGPLGLPLISLAGITCPTLAIELGINAPNQWKQLVKPFAQSISSLIQSENI